MQIQLGVNTAKDLEECLLQINPSLAKEARKTLDLNKSEICGDWKRSCDKGTEE